MVRRGSDLGGRGILLLELVFLLLRLRCGPGPVLVGVAPLVVAPTLLRHGGAQKLVLCPSKISVRNGLQFPQVVFGGSESHKTRSVGAGGSIEEWKAEKGSASTEDEERAFWAEMK